MAAYNQNGQSDWQRWDLWHLNDGMLLAKFITGDGCVLLTSCLAAMLSGGKVV